MLARHLADHPRIKTVAFVYPQGGTAKARDAAFFQTVSDAVGRRVEHHSNVKFVGKNMKSTITSYAPVTSARKRKLKPSKSPTKQRSPSRGKGSGGKGGKGVQKRPSASTSRSR